MITFAKLWHTFQISWFRLWVRCFLNPRCKSQSATVVLDWPILPVATEAGEAPQKLKKWDLPHSKGPPILKLLLQVEIIWYNLTCFETEQEINSKENIVRNGSWGFKQIKCNDQSQISKIVHFEWLKCSYAFLRKFLAFLRKFLAFLRILTRSFSALNCAFRAA